MKEITLGKQGTVGLITYMRTDSTRYADTAKAEAAAFIEDTYGKEFSRHDHRKIKNAQGAQDAHEAGRPTSVLRTPEELKQYLDKRSIETLYIDLRHVLWLVRMTRLF